MIVLYTTSIADILVVYHYLFFSEDILFLRAKLQLCLWTEVCMREPYAYGLGRYLELLPPKKLGKRFFKSAPHCSSSYFRITYQHLGVTSIMRILLSGNIQRNPGPSNLLNLDHSTPEGQRSYEVESPLRRGILNSHLSHDYYVILFLIG